jgi:membrane associated rhomboid family serine protease
VIPLKDLNPTSKSAVLTIVIILACAGVYFPLQQPAGDEFTFEWGAIPCEVLTGEPLGLNELRATLVGGDVNACFADVQESGPELFADKPVHLAVLLSTFMHGSFMHLAGNMLFLWVFGNNIEDRLGHIRFLIFYLAGGLVAALAHVLVEPSSTVPVVGASGAIAAVMGAYLVWFPRAPVLTFIPPFFVLPIRARWFLVIWFGFQFLTDPNSGVAWVAHVAGFLFGAGVGLLVRSNPRAADRVLPHHPPGPWDPSGRSWHQG